MSVKPLIVYDPQLGGFITFEESEANEMKVYKAFCKVKEMIKFKEPIDVELFFEYLELVCNSKWIDRL